MLDYRKNKKLGTALFYILWPLVWIYAPLRTRVRVIIRVKDEILVVKSWFGPNAWQLPGGGMKAGETVSATASREIEEELGININKDNFSILYDRVLIVFKFGIIFRYKYAVVDLTVKPKVTLDSGITDVDWVNIDLLNLPQKVLTSL